MYYLNDEEYKYLKKAIKKLTDPKINPESAFDYIMEIKKMVLSMKKKPEKRSKLRRGGNDHAF
ncbi:MAG: hypothetical protein ACP5T9_03095 [Thermoplasmata archaeon]